MIDARTRQPTLVAMRVIRSRLIRLPFGCDWFIQPPTSAGILVVTECSQSPIITRHAVVLIVSSDHPRTAICLLTLSAFVHADAEAPT